MIFKEIKWTPESKPTQLNAAQVQQKIIHRTFQLGDWLLVRKIDE